MTWEQLPLFTDEELGLQGPKKIEKTVAVQIQELREQIAREIEAKCIEKCHDFDPELDGAPWIVCAPCGEAAAIARGEK